MLSINIILKLMSTIYILIMYWSEKNVNKSKQKTYLSVCIDLYNEWYKWSNKTIGTTYHNFYLNDSDKLIGTSYYYNN